MSRIDHGELFRPSGPTDTIDYVRRRLEARDLTAPEALALLSALHNQLGRGMIQDAGIYSSYSHLVRALELDMPDIHTYILSNWSASRRTRPVFRPQDGFSIFDGLPGERAQADASAAASSDIHDFVRSALQHGSVDSEPEEPGEAAEEDTDDEATQVRVRLEAGHSAVQGDEAEDLEGDEAPKEADGGRDEYELEDAAANEESSAAADLEAAEAEYQDENVSEDAESEGEVPEAFEAHESDTDGITELSEVHADSGWAEESEWPAEQELGPAEDLEPFEGPENEPPPPD